MIEGSPQRQNDKAGRRKTAAANKSLRPFFIQQLLSFGIVDEKSTAGESEQEGADDICQCIVVETKDFIENGSANP